MEENALGSALLSRFGGSGALDRHSGKSETWALSAAIFAKGRVAGTTVWKKRYA
jgi:hypothetical protein